MNELAEPDVATETGGETQPAKHASRASRGARVLLAIVVALILGLGVWAFLQQREISDLKDTEDQRAAAIQAASRQVILLTTVNADTSSADIDRLLQGATKSFRAQFEKDSRAFFATLKDAQVVSKGSVDAAGISKFDDEEAEVLVAATGTVTNTSTKKPEQRVYRLQIKLERVDGDWLVAGMRFVV